MKIKSALLPFLLILITGRDTIMWQILYLFGNMLNAWACALNDLNAQCSAFFYMLIAKALIKSLVI
jgi:hypothetical protein